VLAVLIIVLVLAAAGGAAWLAHRAEQQRRARYLAIAAEHGLSYTPRDDDWTRRFDGAPFGRGSSRRATHVLRGRWRGHEAVAFHYRYVVRSNNGQHTTTTTYRFTVCALRLPAPVPRLEVTSENVLTRLAGALGFEDVELEDEAFNRRFRVQADDRRFAYDVLHARTMERLRSWPALNLRFSGADALIWEKGTCDPEQLLSRLEALSQVVDAVPSYVWSDRSLEGGGAA
jgi:hypothetical protein